jgi:hypothetical protein
MKKAEFIGYLYALRDLAVDDTFDDFDDGVEWILDKVIERAKQLEETTTVPHYPTYPWITYTTGTIKLDNQSNSAYNIKYSDPNAWSVTYDKKNPPNFTVVK